MDYPIRREKTLTRLARLSDGNLNLILEHIKLHPEEVNLQDEYGWLHKDGDDDDNFVHVHACA